MRPVLASFVLTSVGLLTCFDFTVSADNSTPALTDSDQNGLVGPKLCTPGEKQYLECDFCKCVYPGRWRCRNTYPRKWSCLNFRKKRDVPVPSDLRSTPCSANDVFVIDCNRCYCKNDRTGYVCTENLCPLAPTENDGKKTGNGTTRETHQDVPLNGVEDDNGGNNNNHNNNKRN